MRTHSRTVKLLVSLALLAVALTWLISGKEVATAVFQSPPFDSALPTPTSQASVAPTDTVTSFPTPTSPLEPTLPPSPTLSPTPTMTPEPVSSPTPAGFLPPPTLTSPGTPVPAGPSVQVPGELPVRAALTETPGPVSQPGSRYLTTVAALIDRGVLALGYLWLCCGVLALIGTGGALVWFFRRARRV